MGNEVREEDYEGIYLSHENLGRKNREFEGGYER